MVAKPIGATQKFNPNVACIPSNYSRLIARELDLQESELPSLLHMTGLSIDQFMQEDNLLTSHQQIQVLENGLRLSNDEIFGLRLGLRLTPPTHGALGFLASSSPNLLMGLKALQTYLPSRMNFARAEIVTTDDWLEGQCYFDVDLSEEIERCLSEVFAKIVFDFAEFIVGRQLHEGITYFTHAKPQYSQHYSDYLPGQFEFSSERLMVRFPIELSQVQNTSTNPENYLFAMRQCELMQEKLLSNKNTTKYKIQNMMLSHPPGVLCEEEAAATLFISKRTLARRLQKEGAGFRKIRDEILSQQAVDYLRDSNMSVDAIAALLNYHDSTNFRRAFKRWFQKTPDQYRKQL
ncbi:AraC family transcriptional regulator [Gammaproteobacteria bacterium 42_54_T18]|nr:AraC family transcriptional regulator [Gammaproteobacteria bacterium 42_54_T18]